MGLAAQEARACSMARQGRAGRRLEQGKAGRELLTPPHVESKARTNQASRLALCRGCMHTC
jgi:hypothetical protein